VTQNYLFSEIGALEKSPNIIISGASFDPVASQVGCQVSKRNSIHNVPGGLILFAIQFENHFTFFSFLFSMSDYRATISNKPHLNAKVVHAMLKEEKSANQPGHA
jgi:hypothetical protein